MLLYNSIVSKEKAEKVVKDPNKPIIKKYFTKYSDEILFSKLLTNTPIIKEPKTLTKRVPNGKFGKIYLNNNDI